MASAGQFVRERIPVPCSVPEAGRLLLELVSGTRDCEAEPAGPMTFRVTRRYRPTWATATGFLVFPLFIRNTEVCRVAVIEARIGAELLLEGTLDEDLHASLVQLGRVPEAARVSTFGPRPVPQALSSMPPPAEGAPRGAVPPPSASGAPWRPDLIDLRESGDAVQADARRGPGRRDEFSDLIPPPLLPPHGSAAAAPAPAEPGTSRPAGPAPSFQPMHARQPGGNGSNGAPRGRLPSAFRSPWDAVQNDEPRPGDEHAAGESARPEPEDAPPQTVVSRTTPAPAPARVTVSVDSGEEGVVGRLLVIGRAPTRRPDEQHAEVLKVNDPSLSVSKTHLAVESDEQGLWVTDRNSTNGTWIDEGRGALRPVPAQQRTSVPEGSRVLIGERVLTFTRPGA